MDIVIPPNLENDREKRAWLIDEVFYGRIDPQDADSKAMQLGLGLLSFKPPTDEFDPMATATWTLPMVVAWIAYRDVNQVRERWDEYRKECFEWFQNYSIASVERGIETTVNQGHELRQLEPSSMYLLELEEIIGGTLDTEPQKYMPIKKAKHELWNLLTGGGIIASAFDEKSGEIVRIPAQEWPYLISTSDKSLSDQLRLQSNPLIAKYTGVRIERTAIIKRWEPPDEDDARNDELANRQAKKYPIQDVEKWFTEKLVDPWIKDVGPRYTRDEVQKLASASNGPFPDISTKIVREVWKNRRPPGWSVPGRFAK